MGIVMTDWKEGSINYRDFRHSDHYEDWEEVKHRRKRTKNCKRNKGGAHLFTKIIKSYSWLGTKWTVIECEKCGKQKWT
jgi:hypothetical protein